MHGKSIALQEHQEIYWLGFVKHLSGHGRRLRRILRKNLCIGNADSAGVSSNNFAKSAGVLVIVGSWSFLFGLQLGNVGSVFNPTTCCIHLSSKTLRLHGNFSFLRALYYFFRLKTELVFMNLLQKHGFMILNSLPSLPRAVSGAHTLEGLSIPRFGLGVINLGSLNSQSSLYWFKYSFTNKVITASAVSKSN